MFVPVSLALVASQIKEVFLSYRVKHYAAKTPSASFGTNWETIVTEILVGIICLGMGYVGYEGEMILMYIPLFFVSGMCFLMAIHAIVSGIRHKREIKKNAATKKT